MWKFYLKKKIYHKRSQLGNRKDSSHCWTVFKSQNRQASWLSFLFQIVQIFLVTAAVSNDEFIQFK